MRSDPINELSNNKIKKLKDKKIAIKRIRTLFEKKLRG
jgi:hypothetical protein